MIRIALPNTLPKYSSERQDTTRGRHRSALDWAASVATTSKLQQSPLPEFTSRVYCLINGNQVAMTALTVTKPSRATAHVWDESHRFPSNSTGDANSRDAYSHLDDEVPGLTVLDLYTTAPIYTPRADAPTVTAHGRPNSVDSYSRAASAAAYGRAEGDQGSPSMSEQNELRLRRALWAALETDPSTVEVATEAAALADQVIQEWHRKRHEFLQACMHRHMSNLSSSAVHRVDNRTDDCVMLLDKNFNLNHEINESSNHCYSRDRRVTLRNAVCKYATAVLQLQQIAKAAPPSIVTAATARPLRIIDGSTNASYGSNPTLATFLNNGSASVPIESTAIIEPFNDDGIFDDKKTTARVVDEVVSTMEDAAERARRRYYSNVDHGPPVLRDTDFVESSIASNTSVAPAFALAAIYNNNTRHSDRHNPSTDSNWSNDSRLRRITSGLPADVAAAVGLKLREGHEKRSVRLLTQMLEFAAVAASERDTMLSPFGAAPIPTLKTPLTPTAVPHDSTSVDAKMALTELLQQRARAMRSDYLRRSKKYLDHAGNSRDIAASTALNGTAAREVLAAADLTAQLTSGLGHRLRTRSLGGRLNFVCESVLMPRAPLPLRYPTTPWIGRNILGADAGDVSVESLEGFVALYIPSRVPAVPPCMLRHRHDNVSSASLRLKSILPDLASEFSVDSLRYGANTLRQDVHAVDVVTLASLERSELSLVSHSVPPTWGWGCGNFNVTTVERDCNHSSSPDNNCKQECARVLHFPTPTVTVNGNAPVCTLFPIQTELTSNSSSSTHLNFADNVTHSSNWDASNYSNTTSCGTANSSSFGREGGWWVIGSAAQEEQRARVQRLRVWAGSANALRLSAAQALEKKQQEPFDDDANKNLAESGAVNDTDFELLHDRAHAHRGRVSSNNSGFADTCGCAYRCVPVSDVLAQHWPRAALRVLTQTLESAVYGTNTGTSTTLTTLIPKTDANTTSSLKDGTFLGCSSIESTVPATLNSCVNATTGCCSQNDTASAVCNRQDGGAFDSGGTIGWCNWEPTDVSSLLTVTPIITASSTATSEPTVISVPLVPPSMPAVATPAPIVTELPHTVTGLKRFSLTVTSLPGAMLLQPGDTMSTALPPLFASAGSSNSTLNASIAEYVKSVDKSGTHDRNRNRRVFMYGGVLYHAVCRSVSDVPPWEISGTPPTNGDSVCSGNHEHFGRSSRESTSRVSRHSNVGASAGLGRRWAKWRAWTHTLS